MNKAKMLVHIYIYSMDKEYPHKVDFTKKRLCLISHRDCFGAQRHARISYMHKLGSMAITASWLCKVESVSCGQASSVCANGRCSRPADGELKCFAPRDWPACL